MACYTLETLNQMDVSSLIGIILDMQKELSGSSVKKKSPKKNVKIQTSGTFSVFLNGEPLKLAGRERAVFALVTAQNGNYISFRDIYETIWPGRAYTNVNMKVFYNTTRNLKRKLDEYGIPDILLSNKHGFCINTKAVDCDYYNNPNADKKQYFSEFAWRNEL